MNKLDLIVDALESAHCTNDTAVMGLTKSRLDAALAAARELRDMKPVAYIGVVAGGRFDTYLKAKKVDLYGCDWVKPLFLLGDTDE